MANMGKAVQKQAPTFVNIDGSRWYAANRVAFQLGYKRPHGAVCKHVTLGNQATLRTLKTNGVKEETNFTANHNLLETKYINKNGLRQLVARSRKPESIKYAQELGIDVSDIKPRFEEMATLAPLMEVFDGQDMVQQFAIGCYRIDLYFPEHQIAVECDERGHADRDTTKERERQDNITEQLGCRWIRFDPHVPGFCILRVANRIVRLLLPNAC